MAKLLLDLPKALKSKLKALRKHGFTMNGFVRAAVEEKLNQPLPTKKGARP